MSLVYLDTSALLKLCVLETGSDLAVALWSGADALVTSPREAALSAEAPPPSVITAQAEARQVRQEVITRGTVQAEQRIENKGGYINSSWRDHAVKVTVA